MRIEELSIGDWVLCDGEYWKISAIEEDSVGLRCDSDYSAALLEECDPILLTPEILEKNGKTNKDYLAWLIAGRAVVEKEPTGEYSVHIYDAAIDKVLVTACAQHVHQLQHAFRLAGIEKEIEL